MHFNKLSINAKNFWKMATEGLEYLKGEFWFSLYDEQDFNDGFETNKWYRFFYIDYYFSKPVRFLSNRTKL